MGELIIAALATYGISALVAEYPGYRDVFVRLRNKYPNSAINCTVCLSVWVSCVLFGVVLIGFGYYLAPLAYVGVVIALERL